MNFRIRILVYTYIFLRSIGFFRRNYHDFLSMKSLIKFIFKRKEEFYFVQIGGNDGISFDWLYDFIKEKKSLGIIVEPVSEYFKQLEQNYSNPDITLLNVAIHPSKKQEIIYFVDKNRYENYSDWVKGIASFDKNHLLTLGINLQHIVENIVSCMHFHEIIHLKKISYLDYIQIDTEGFDFEIIKMIPFNELKPKVIRYENQNLSEDDCDSCRCLLIENGYYLVDFENDTLAVLFKR